MINVEFCIKVSLSVLIYVHIKMQRLYFWQTQLAHVYFWLLSALIRAGLIVSRALITMDSFMLYIVLSYYYTDKIFFEKKSLRYISYYNLCYFSFTLFVQWSIIFSFLWFCLSSWRNESCILSLKTFLISFIWIALLFRWCIFHQRKSIDRDYNLYQL